MKPTLKIQALPFLVLGAGGTGLVLRVLLYTLAVDNRGLIPRNHPLHMLSILLTLFVVALVVISVQNLRGSNSYSFNFPQSRAGFVGNLFAAGWLLTAAFTLLEEAEGALEMLHFLLALVNVPCLVFTGYCRLKSKRPAFFCHGLLCLFLALNMICQYRSWSGDPQVEGYLFHIFACVFLALTAYYRTAFDLGMGKRRLYLLFSLMSVYFCFLSLVGAGDGKFYFGLGIWAFTNLYPLQSKKKREVA